MRTGKETFWQRKEKRKQLKTWVWGPRRYPSIIPTKSHTCYWFPVKNSSDAIERGYKKSEGSRLSLKLSGHRCPAPRGRCARFHGALANVDARSSHSWSPPTTPSLSKAPWLCGRRWHALNTSTFGAPGSAAFARQLCSTAFLYRWKTHTHKGAKSPRTFKIYQLS